MGVKTYRTNVQKMERKADYELDLKVFFNGNEENHVKSSLSWGEDGE